MEKVICEITPDLKLKGITCLSRYENGALRDCILNEENLISTRYGYLIPRYGADDVRKKYKPSISFYPSGAVRSISLERQSMVNTPLGTFPAELVTFYESGAIKRLFPLNGKISGYWTEVDEEKLCTAFQFRFNFGSFKTKIISLNFYDNGNLKAMTIWPGESIILKRASELLPVRIGFSLYEDGSLKSIEPAYELPLATPIGNITAYDESAPGMCGDNNSLCLNRDGSLYSLKTSSSKIAVFDKDGSFDIIGPSLKADPLEEDEFTIIPLKITFYGHFVKFEAEKTSEYDIRTSRFTVINASYPGTGKNLTCGDCSSCSLCK